MFASRDRTARSTICRYFISLAIFIPCIVSLMLGRLQHVLISPTLLKICFTLAPLLASIPLAVLAVLVLQCSERECRKSEERLRISVQRFSSVVATTMDAIIMLDGDHNVITFNLAAEKVFGCPAQEALGKPLDRFLPHQFREIHKHHINKFGESRISKRSMALPGIIQALRANGEHFPVEATVSTADVAGDKVYTVILRDITERERAQDSLRHSEARFRSIYEQAAVGIEQISLDRRLLMANPAMCRFLGYPESELLGKRCAEFTHPDDYAREIEIMDAADRDHQTCYEVEKRCRHSDGSIVWAHVTASMVYGPNGDPLYRIAIVEDITARKHAEEQLRQAQKLEAIGRLAGGVAHDFNTLLNVILGYSEILLAELPLSDPRRDRVLQIQNSGDAGAMLTKRLLAISRNQGIAKEVLDLRSLAKMTPILTRLLRDDIELSVQCSDEVCPVKVDPGQMQQLVLNLVANAGDAMPDGGRLEIDVRVADLPEELAGSQSDPQTALDPGHYASLSVSDSGTGMDAETASHIFEPFFTTKGVGSGTGLGLATVYGIVKRNGGDILVSSQPGAGTTFRVFLPLCAESVKSVAASVPPRALGGDETILLVEDSEALRELTKVILTRNGYKVLEAEDGLAALETSSSYEGTIHMVLTDIVMPRLRGPEMVEQLVTQRPDIAVIFLSGYTEDAIPHLDGMTGFRLVEKPYAAASLLHSIRCALDDSTAGDKGRSLAAHS